MKEIPTRLYRLLTLSPFLFFFLFFTTESFGLPLKKDIKDGPDSPLVTVPCSSAKVACTGNIYTFPSGTSGTAPPPVGGYPNYGCLGFNPGPAWYYMQVGTAGDIIITISQVNLVGIPMDVDFVCWGPFSSLTDGCTTGLTAGNIIDCSISALATETCHILNAQAGKFYILLMTNFIGNPGWITFSQTSGSGVTNCNMVVHCSINAMTRNTSACDQATNTFSVSGNIEFTNPSPTGTLTITDVTAIPPVSQTFTSPFVSPLAYSLANIPCDGAVHTITAVFSDSLNCNLSQQITAPAGICPQAHISGGGTICADGVQQALVSVNFPVGQPPFTFVYAINGSNQPPVIQGSLLPYQISTTTPGIYTLVSVSNQNCVAGTVSGSATVNANPLPVATISGSAIVCLNSASPQVTFTGSPGTPPFTFTYNINGGSNQVVSTSSGNSVTVNVPTSLTGVFNYNLVSVQESSSLACSQLQAGSAAITVNPLPSAFVAGTASVCLEATAPLITFTGSGTTAPYTFQYNINGGPVLIAATTTGNSVSLPVPTNVAGTFNYNLVSVQDGSITGCSQLQTGSATITVNPPPVPVITGPQGTCINTSGNYTTELNMSGYSWTVSAGGNIVSGGSAGTASIHWSAAGAQTVSVTYTNSNGCSAGTATNYAVTVFPLPLTAIIEDPGPECQSMPHVFQVPADPGTTFDWSVIPGANGTITSGQGSNAVTINWQAGGSATIAVTGTSIHSCVSSSTLPVVVNNKPNPVFTPCFDLVTIPGARKIILHGGIPALPVQGVYSGTRVALNAISGNYEFDPSGATAGTYPVMYTYTNTRGCPASAGPVSITVQNSSFACGTSLTDVRDGHIYTTAFLAGHCWMTENLNYGTILTGTPAYSQSDNCQAEKYCVPADVTCSNYGGLYQWDELMDYSNTPGTKGLCPPGWHVPSDTEWQQLIDNLVPGITAPAANGFVAGWLTDPVLPTGFHAVLDGLNYLDNTWAFSSGTNKAAMYWTSTLFDANRTIARGLNSYNYSISKYNSARANAFSVRCVMD